MGRSSLSSHKDREVLKSVHKVIQHKIFDMFRFITMLMVALMAVTLVVESSPLRGVKRCKPGTTFMVECNRCICMGLGIPACTKMMCHVFLPPKILISKAQ